MPLIRKDGVPKGHDDDRSIPANPWTHFRQASWEEALDRAAGGLKRIRDQHGGNALAGFGSAKGSNEEAYLFQKLVRTGFGTNNVDHCTRLCHASSVAALMERIGSGAVTAPFMAAKDADVIIVIGANPTENHPVAATFIKNAVKRGVTLIVMDPRGQTLKRHATHMLQFKPGRDVSLLNAMLHVIITEELYDRQYVQAHTEDFEKLRENVKNYPPEKMADDLRHRRRHAAPGGAQVRPGRGGHDLLGHGHLPARPRHRQRALPDRARPGRPARSAGPAPGCIRCAARTTCRAPRTPG